MRPSVLFSAYAAAALIICANFLAIPGFWITLYGARADAQAVFLYRLIAALFGGIAALSWAARGEASSPGREAIAQGLVVVNGLAAVVGVVGAVSGVYNQFAWGAAGMFALFTLGFALRTPEPRPAVESA